MLQLAFAQAGAPVTPLSQQEKIRLRSLVQKVEHGVSTFLEVGAALIELRSSRLYRETHSTFESFCRDTFGLARSTCDGMIRSASVAQTLKENGIELAPTTSEAVLRPVAALPSPELQRATWRLIESASPRCGPTQPVASKIARVIKNAIEPAESNDNGHKPRSREHTAREVPFLRPVTRLGSYPSFDARLVVSHLDKFIPAAGAYTMCGKLIERCQAVRQVLETKFAELAK